MDGRLRKVVIVAISILIVFFLVWGLVNLFQNIPMSSGYPSEGSSNNSNSGDTIIFPQTIIVDDNDDLEDWGWSDWDSDTDTGSSDYWDYDGNDDYGSSDDWDFDDSWDSGSGDDWDFDDGWDSYDSGGYDDSWDSFDDGWDSYDSGGYSDGWSSDDGW